MASGIYKQLYGPILPKYQFRVLHKVQLLKKLNADIANIYRNTRIGTASRVTAIEHFDQVYLATLGLLTSHNDTQTDHSHDRTIRHHYYTLTCHNSGSLSKKLPVAKRRRYLQKANFWASEKAKFMEEAHLVSFKEHNNSISYKLR